MFMPEPVSTSPPFCRRSTSPLGVIKAGYRIGSREPFSAVCNRVATASLAAKPSAGPSTPWVAVPTYRASTCGSCRHLGPVLDHRDLVRRGLERPTRQV